MKDEWRQKRPNARSSILDWNFLMGTFLIFLEVVIKLMKSSGFLETDEPPLLFPTVLDGISFARARLLNEWPLVQQFGCKNGNIKN